MAEEPKVDPFDFIPAKNGNDVLPPKIDPFWIRPPKNIGDDPPLPAYESVVGKEDHKAGKWFCRFRRVSF